MNKIEEKIHKYLGEGKKWDKFKDKMFKKMYGKSKEEVRETVRNLSDEELKFLAKSDFTKSKGAQKIQGEEIYQELKRRGISTDIFQKEKK